jgi:hypothetical protein
LNINILAISYASKHPETGLILFKILVFKREKLQLGLTFWSNIAALLLGIPTAGLVMTKVIQYIKENY